MFGQRVRLEVDAEVVFYKGFKQYIRATVEMRPAVPCPNDTFDILELA
jgi:hypothetical protein